MMEKLRFTRQQWTQNDSIATLLNVSRQIKTGKYSGCIGYMPCRTGMIDTHDGPKPVLFGKIYLVEVVD